MKKYKISAKSNYEYPSLYTYDPMELPPERSVWPEAIVLGIAVGLIYLILTL